MLVLKSISNLIPLTLIIGDHIIAVLNLDRPTLASDFLLTVQASNFPDFGQGGGHPLITTYVCFSTSECFQ